LAILPVDENLLDRNC